MVDPRPLSIPVILGTTRKGRASSVSAPSSSRSRAVVRGLALWRPATSCATSTSRSVSTAACAGVRSASARRRLPLSWPEGSGSPKTGGWCWPMSILEDPPPRLASGVGDIVLTLDGKVMENARQFQVNLYPRGVGEIATLEVLRGDRRATFSVAPIDRPDDPDRFQQMVRPDEHLIARLRILALNLTPDVAAMVPGLRQRHGVVVAVSSPRAVPVRGEPLLPGDVIHALNGSPIVSLAGLQAALDQLGPGDPVVLQVARSAELSYVTLTLD